MPDGERARPSWFPTTRRVLVAVTATVLAVNAVVLLGAASTATEPGAVAATTTTSAPVPSDEASDELASTAPALDPLAGITMATTVVDDDVDTDVELPVPKAPPADPYAPTPEIRHGVLEIPAIGLRQPLFEGVTLTSINRGPSHWPGTAMPGEIGNVVVAGHRTTYTRPFWDLQAVEPGDELIFTMNDGTRHVYVLDRIEVVAPTDVHIVDQTHDRTATLFACHPRGSARQRIVGHFELQPELHTVQVADTQLIRAPRT